MNAACVAVPRTLQPGEVLRFAGSVPLIVYYRHGNESQPLAVFLPGGGHLARVAYGHEAADRRDFIDCWLEKEGFGLLALSYPSDHPVFPVDCPDLSISQWASSIAELVHDHVRERPQREIVLLGWSMAGRSLVAIERALRIRGLSQRCFVSLAATAPLPNLLPASALNERFTSRGFWDSSTRHSDWLEQVERQIGASGRAAIDPESYVAHYVVNSPFSLRGQTRDATMQSEAVLTQSIGAFTYEDYPLVAAIIPEGVADRLHALTDRALWGALNVLRIARGIERERSIDAGNWSALRALLADVPQRLARTIPGGHFFFIGETGAVATVRHIIDLTNEAQQLRDTLQALVEAPITA